LKTLVLAFYSFREIGKKKSQSRLRGMVGDHQQEHRSAYARNRVIPLNRQNKWIKPRLAHGS
jgi:hypothetical protein